MIPGTFPYLKNRFRGGIFHADHGPQWELAERIASSHIDIPNFGSVAVELRCCSGIDALQLRTIPCVSSERNVN